MNSIKRFLSPVQHYRYGYWFFIVLAVGMNMVISYLSSSMNKYIFEGIEYQNHELFHLGIRYGLILLGVTLVYPFSRYFHIRLVRHIVYDLKMRMVERLTFFETVYFDNHHSGETIQKISNDADSMKTAYFTGVYSVINNLCVGLFVIGLMLFVHWGLALISISMSLVSLGILRVYNNIIKENYSEIHGRMIKLLSMFSDILQGIVVIKMSQGASRLFQRYDEENTRVNRDYDRGQKLQARMDTYNFLAGSVATFGTIFVGVLLVNKGYLDYGVVMSMATLQITLGGIIGRIGTSFSGMSRAVTRFEGIHTFLETPMEQFTRKTTWEEGRGGIETKVQVDQENQEENLAIHLSKVSFAYDSNLVIEDLNLKIVRGSKCLLIGPSGSGKSSLFKLLLGYYPIQSGQLYIVGKPIEDYEPKALRQQFAYVSQEPYLFEGTIMENIAGFDDQLDVEEVKKAARWAGIDTYIESLEETYETMVEQGGKNFSGGQGQRLAIARALYRKAPILLLDEVASALDSESEYHLMESLDQLSEDVTVLMITHRSEELWNKSRYSWRKIYTLGNQVNK